MKKSALSILKKINWQKVDGLVPAVVQNIKTGQVIMLGYMNQEAIQKTFSTKKMWFYSRTKKRLWMKGETSNNFLKFVDMILDCDCDTLLVKVDPISPSCHTGNLTCFENDQSVPSAFLITLFDLIQNRNITRPEGSYTAFLFEKGLDKMGEKIYEEAAEVVRAAKKETKKRLIEESVDLLYHLFVLLVEKQVSLGDVMVECRNRNA